MKSRRRTNIFSIHVAIMTPKGGHDYFCRVPQLYSHTVLTVLISAGRAYGADLCKSKHKTAFCPDDP